MKVNTELKTTVTKEYTGEITPKMIREAFGLPDDAELTYEGYADDPMTFTYRIVEILND